MSRNYIGLVSQFHQVFNHPIIDHPAIPNEERVKLRLKLIAEEFAELAQACADKDIVEAADALVDLQYVLSGAIMEFGLTFCFNDLFDAVHASNMAKSSQTAEHALESQSIIEETEAMDGTEISVVERGGRYLLYDQHGKTRKPAGWKKPDLAAILKPHMKNAPDN